MEVHIMSKLLRREPRAQQGVALIFSLLALVALTLGAVALIRSVDSGVLALGNLSFKQSGLTSGAKGADAAIEWLTAHVGETALNADITASGYYATSMDSLDVTRRTVDFPQPYAQVDWDDNTCKVNGVSVASAGCHSPSAAMTVNGDTVRYIITRLCSKALPTYDAANSCAAPVVSSSTDALGRGALGYDTPEHTGSPSYSPYFRIITRTVGPKGTVSFTETLVRF
jgi:type IV pilus assembly protein PilX